MDNYFQDRDKASLDELRRLRQQLPRFCSEYFVGIASGMSVLTRLGYARDLCIFFNFLISLPEFAHNNATELTLAELDKVTQSNIEEFLEYVSVYTVNGVTYTNNEASKLRKLSAIRSLFKYLYNKDKLSQNVASKVMTPKVHDHEIIRLESQEMQRLLDEVESADSVDVGHYKAYHEHVALRDTAIVTLLLGTGIRISECVGLNVDDIDFENRQFTITRKGGSRTILYLPDEVVTCLQDYLTQRLAIDAATDALFLSLQNKRINVRTVQVLVKKYASMSVPLKHITPHKLRSTYGTNLYRETKDIYVVAEVLGHRDVNTTKKHYAAISEDIKRYAAQSVRIRADKQDTTPPPDDTDRP